MSSSVKKAAENLTADLVRATIDQPGYEPQGTWNWTPRPSERMADEVMRKSNTPEPKLPMHTPPMRSNVQRFADKAEKLGNPDREADQVLREIEDRRKQTSLCSLYNESENER